MVVSKRIELDTKGEGEVSDITAEVSRAVRESGLGVGTVTVFISGSTAGVTTAEYEPGLVEDLKALWERVVPRGIDYRHNLRWGDNNGHAHVRASLLGPSLTIPFAEGRLLLGTWQQVVVIDFDIRPRRRQVVLQTVGD